MINPSDSIENQYAEAMELFGGKPIPKIGEPVEYTYSYTCSDSYQKAMIEKYGHVPDLANMIPVDEDVPTDEQLRAENRAMQDVPDDDLDDLEYYGRHGYSRTAPTCTDPDCPCED